MTEVLRFTQLGKQDIKLGTGTFEARLGDGRVVTLDAVDISDLFRVVYISPPGSFVASPASVSYTELASMLRQQIDFSRRTSVLARVVVTGFGNESGNGKGVAITDASGNVLASVTWDGDAEATRVGSWTQTTISADTLTQFRARGATATESLILHSVVFEGYKSLT